VYNLGGGNYGYGTSGGPISIMNEKTRFGDKYYKWNPDGNGGYTPEELTRQQRTGWMAKVGNLVEAVTPAIVGSMAAGAFNIGPFSPNGAFAPAGAGSGAGWTSGYDLAGGSGLPTGASGGIFGTGFSTGSAFGDWAAKQAAGMGLRAGIGSLIGGGSPSTGKSGGSGMADSLFGSNALETLLAAGVLNNSGQRVSDAYTASANNVMNLANQLKDQGKFTPYNISTGLGSVTSNADGSMSTSLDPRFQGVQDAALGQIGSLLTPYTNQNVSDISGQAYDLSKEWLAKRANPLYAQNEQKGLFGAGQLLDKAAAFDPEANARAEYDLMQKIFAPTRESDNLAMETRLMNQGRLGLNYGSYGAAPELMALKEAQRRQDLQATKDSRQLAFDRQNNMISQAGALNDIGIKSGAAGTAQQKAYYDMANGLFGMGMSGDKFIEDMNNSRTSRANTMLGMALKPEEMMQQNMATAINAGNARSNAEQANARLFGNLGLEAERLRSSGAFADAGFKNSRDNAILQAISGKGGAGGLLAGAGGALSNLPGLVGDLAKKLLASGIPEESLADVMGEMGIEMDQFLPEGSTWGEFDLSNLDLGGGGGEWTGFGDMDFDLISW
jgi:hypothetical protein